MSITPLEPNKAGTFWFMRKHGVLPSVDQKGSPGKLNGIGAVAEHALQPQAPTTSRPPSVRPQREFLHRALLAIGASIEEGTEVKLPPFPQRGTLTPRARSQGASARMEILRKRYADHTNAECEMLEAAVAAREKEVDALKTKVKQMEASMKDTQRAIDRRMNRDSGIQQKSNKKNILDQGATRGASKEKEEADASPDTPKLDIFQELHANIEHQIAEESERRAEIDEMLRVLEHQTVERKSREAGLFNAQGQVLEVRSQALQVEARVKRLSKELRRIYTSLPEMLQVRLAETSASRAECREAEVESLTATHATRHFKFMDAAKLLEKTAEYQAQAEAMQERIEVASEALQMSPVQQAQVDGSLEVIMTAIRNVQKAWKRLSDDPSSHAHWNDGLRGTVDEASRVLQQAELRVNALNSMVAELKGKSGSSGEGGEGEGAVPRASRLSVPGV